MMGLFEAFMEGAGLPMQVGDGLIEYMTDDEFKNDYSYVVEDIEEGSVSTVVEASAGTADVDFAPECERRGMMDF